MLGNKCILHLLNDGNCQERKNLEVCGQNVHAIHVYPNRVFTKSILGLVAFSIRGKYTITYTSYVKKLRTPHFQIYQLLLVSLCRA